MNMQQFYKTVLDTNMGNTDAGDNITIRQYLCKLLQTLMEEKEGFSGKRPFGNSGWEYALYTALVKNNIIFGYLDEDGRFESGDLYAADELISDLIVYVFTTGGEE